jgi:hypothetical protein
MLVLSRSLLNREYIVISVLKALASIISMCNLHVTFLSKIAPILCTIYKRNVSSIQCKIELGWSTTARKLDPPSPTFINSVNCQLLLTTRCLASGRTTAKKTHPLPTTLTDVVYCCDFAGTCFLSRCLAVDMWVTIYIDSNFHLVLTCTYVFDITCCAGTLHVP